MKNLILSITLLCSLLLSSCGNKKTKEISKEEYLDKMKAAWVGQMAGVGWGLPTEFKFPDSIIPDSMVPEWKPAMLNQQGNDDLYVEMTFLSSMLKYGIEVSSRQAGIDFANAGYRLWAANEAGRENLRFGIAPPESGHPEFSNNCDDIDFQIEADFSGIISPGMPGIAVELGNKFGSLMNYGDGLWAGQFVGGMYSEAFFENDIMKIIETGLSCIPDESLYEQCIRDVIAWYNENPTDWKKTWSLIEEKYHKNTEYQPFAEKSGSWIPIDAKLNGAYIVMGLLYGEGNLEKTILISMQCGKDSDCNPSNAAGILATTIGFKSLPEKFRKGIDEEKKFSYCEFGLGELINISEKLCKDIIVKNGGRITEKEGKEIWMLPCVDPIPAPFYPSYNPAAPDMDNRYTSEELGKINAWSSLHFKPLFEKTGLAMDVYDCGKGIRPEIASKKGRENIITTVPIGKDRSIRMNTRVQGIGTLNFSVAGDKGSPFILRLSAGGKNLVNERIDQDQWRDFEILLENEGETGIDILVSPEGMDLPLQYWSGFKFNKK